MASLVLEAEAVADLKSLAATGAVGKTYAQRIAVILQEIKNSPALQECLLTDRFTNADFDVGKYLHFWNDGFDLWKLKLRDCNALREKWWAIPYRILYAYDSKNQRFHILGVVHRSFNYEPRHEFTKRILAAYDDLGLPRHRIHGAGKGRNKPH